MPAFEFPQNFDPNRVNWNSNIGDSGDIGLDPKYPGFVVRRLNLHSPWMWNPDTDSWETDEPSNKPYAQMPAQASIQAAIAQTELDTLEASGLNLPKHSTFNHHDPSRETIYNYVEYLRGDVFEPGKPQHGKHVVPFIRKGVRYLEQKARMDSFLVDPLYARNSTVTTAGRLVLHDLDPIVEPVIVTRQRNEYPSMYERVLNNFTMTVTEAASARSINTNQAQSLLGDITKLWNK